MKKQIIFLLVALAGSYNFCYTLNPEKAYKYSPDQFGLEYREIKVETIDGYKINCWLFNPATATNKQTVIIANGDAGNMSYSLYYVKQLIKLGCRVVTFDYRGFGQSSDFKINNDFLFYYEFSYDLNAVVEYVKDNIAKNTSLGIMAFSMGTIVTTLSYPKIKENIRFIMAENFVIDPYLVKTRLQEFRSKSMIVPNNISQKQYREQLASIDTPMLIFAAKKDSITTWQDSEDVKNSIRSTCNIVSYNGEHGRGLSTLTKKNTGDIYFHEVSKFLNSQQ